MGQRLDAEVGVVGVGSVGSMALWHIARRGVSVVGLEQFAPGHDRGAAGGDMRTFRTAYLEGENYVPLLLAAYHGWRELEDLTRARLLELCGEITIADQSAIELKTMLRGIEEFALDHELLDAVAAGKRYPQHVFSPDEVALIDKQAGFLRSEYAVALATRLAEQAGAVVHRQSRVEGIEPDESGVTVWANGRRYCFRQVVLAAGPWLAALLPELAAEIDVKRAVLAWYAAPSPTLYSPERFPAFVRLDGASSVYGTPTADGWSVRVGLLGDSGSVEDPDRFDRSVAEEWLKPINDAVRTRLPGLLPDPTRIGTYMDAWSSDGHAIVGRHPGLPNVVLLCAFSGHGFKLAPVMGQAAGDLAVDGETQLPIDHLAPDRFVGELSRAFPKASRAPSSPEE